MANKEVEYCYRYHACENAHEVSQNLPPASPRPPVSSISPSNKPALSRERDHSACRRPDTPLKVRKTRENLKQQSIHIDIPPPCVHQQHENEHRSAFNENVPSENIPCDLSSFDGNRIYYPPHDFNEASTSLPSLQQVKPLQSALPPVQMSPATSGLQRQKSASRRMLSRVKQGISRSKGVQSVRPADSETSLMRRLSGRRKLSTDVESRAHSFEISRQSIDSCIEESSGSLESVPPTARSFTNSTVSTASIFEDASIHAVPPPPGAYFDKPMVLDLSQACGSSSPPPSSPTPQQTPKPPRKNLAPVPIEPDKRPLIIVPFIELDVAQDCETLDIRAKRNVWIAVTATVRAHVIDVSAPTRAEVNVSDDSAHPVSGSHASTSKSFMSQASGTITTLRLCFKSEGASQIRDIIGRKTFKDLKIGQQCDLFIRLRVPKIRPKTNGAEPDQDSLFTELESIVGTLETDILHIEARYRHSMLPSDNVVTVRHLCKIQRPKIESRWSMIGATTPATLEAQKRLTRYIATMHAPGRALELLDDYLDYEGKNAPEAQEILKSLALKCERQQHDSIDNPKPSVIITDIDWNLPAGMIDLPEQFSTAPSTPSGTADRALRSQPTIFNLGHRRQPSSISLFSPTTLAPPLISAPKTTTALSISASQSTNNLHPDADPSLDSEDRARQLWRHIRRTSLSAKQIAEMGSDCVDSLEAGDEALLEIRRRALANKRSVGAETLKGWKWEESQSKQHHHVEAPWM